MKWGYIAGSFQAGTVALWRICKSWIFSRLFTIFAKKRVILCLLLSVADSASSATGYHSWNHAVSRFFHYEMVVSMGAVLYCTSEHGGGGGETIRTGSELKFVRQARYRQEVLVRLVAAVMFLASSDHPLTTERLSYHTITAQRKLLEDFRATQLVEAYCEHAKKYVNPSNRNSTDLQYLRIY